MGQNGEYQEGGGKMSFTQPAFIRKNTPELREKLEQLGYNFILNGYGEWNTPIKNCKYISVSKGHFIGRVCKPNIGINCLENEDLFLAIAALRDDSDNGQWFTDGKDYWQQCIGSFRYPFLAKERLHKATVLELIEHFKDTL